MLRQHAGVLALTAVFGLHALWAAIKWSPYYSFRKAPRRDAFEDHMKRQAQEEYKNGQ